MLEYIKRRYPQEKNNAGVHKKETKDTENQFWEDTAEECAS